VDHIACMGGMRSAYKIVILKPEGKRSLGRPMGPCVSIIMIGVVMLGVHLPASCRMVSQGSTWVDLESSFLFKTSIFGLVTVLLLCLVSKLQEPPSPRIELKTVLWSFDLSMFSSWSQGISVPSLVQICLSLLEL
jgi:hypothetical protein